MHVLAHLESTGAAKPPKWLSPNTMYLTLMGSHAYGCSTEESDLDVYGFAVPPKEIVFPHLAGVIPGFGHQGQRFDQYQVTGVCDKDANVGKGQVYDVTVYGIVKYFQLVMDGNPNMLDSLFTPRTCVIHSTQLSEMVRERRKLFLSKKCWHTFRGYAFSQLHKMSTKTPQAGSKRLELREKYGYDVKFAAHLVRLIQEVEQILSLGDMDLRRDREMLKDIRRGGWSEQQVRDWFARREPELESLYRSTTAVPQTPNEGAIKAILLECLEAHYGSLEKAVASESRLEQALKDIRLTLERAGY